MAGFIAMSALAGAASEVLIDDWSAFSPGEAISADSRPAAWHLVHAAESPSGWRLETTVDTVAPDLRVPLPAKGVYEIRIGVYMPDTLTSGVLAKLESEPCFAFMRGHLDGRYPAYHEVLYTTAECTDASLIVRQPAEYRSYLTHIRLVPRDRVHVLPKATKQVIGMDCTFHRYYFFSMREEGTSALGVNMHRLNGFTEEVFCGGRSVLTYETRVGTPHKSERARPRTHWLHDHSITHKPLANALQAGKELGVDISTRLSMNCHYHGSYSNTLTSQFVLDHPQWHDKRRDGTVDYHRMCYGYAEVRAERLAIFREMVEMGSRHLFVDCRRYMPMTQWGDPYIEGFQREHGVDPRGLKESDALWPVWLVWRADHFTRILRNLRAWLRGSGNETVPISLRVNAETIRQNLEHGVDLRRIVAEGLVDRIILGEKDSRPFLTEYLTLVKGKQIALLGCLNVHGRALPGPEHHTKGAWPAAMYATPDIDRLARVVDDFYDAGLDGVAFYETDEATAMPRMRRFFIACRRPETLKAFIRERRKDFWTRMEERFPGFSFSHSAVPRITSSVGPIDGKKRYRIENAIDGNPETHYIADRGCCEPSGPGCTITLEFDRAIESHGIAMLTRTEHGDGDWAPRELTVQVSQKGKWVDVPGMPATGLAGPAVMVRYTPVKTTGIRVHLRKVTGGANNPDIVELTWE